MNLWIQMLLLNKLTNSHNFIIRWDNSEGQSITQLTPTISYPISTLAENEHCCFNYRTWTAKKTTFPLLRISARMNWFVLYNGWKLDFLSFNRHLNKHMWFWPDISTYPTDYLIYFVDVKKSIEISFTRGQITSHSYILGAYEEKKWEWYEEIFCI